MPPRRQPDLPDAIAHQVIARAIELDAASGETMPVTRLHEIAREVGISRDALERALAEVAPAAVGHAEAGAPPMGYFRRLWRRLAGRETPVHLEETPDLWTLRGAAEAMATNVLAFLAFWLPMFVITPLIRNLIGAHSDVASTTQIVVGTLVGMAIAHRFRARGTFVVLGVLVIAMAVSIAQSLSTGPNASGFFASTGFSWMLAAAMGILAGYLAGRSRSKVDAEPRGPTAANAPATGNAPTEARGEAERDWSLRLAIAPLLSVQARRGLAVALVVGLPLPLLAQGPASDWARVIRHRDCHPADACPPRRGMVWDTTNAAPAYPEVLRAVGIGGDAEIAFHVRADGTVEPGSVTAVRASHPVFQRSAIEAARRWRFGTELAGRPAEAISLRMHLIFSQIGPCRGGGPTQQVGVAAEHQLVIAACASGIPRTRVSTIPDSVTSRQRRFDAPITRQDSVAIARQVVRILLADRTRLPVGIVSDPQGSPWHPMIESLLAAEHPEVLVPRSAVSDGGLLLTVSGDAGSAVLEVGLERCEPAIGRLHAEVTRYVPRVEQGAWSLVTLPNALIVSGKCPARSGHNG